MNTDIMTREIQPLLLIQGNRICHVVENLEFPSFYKIKQSNSSFMLFTIKIEPRRQQLHVIRGELGKMSVLSAVSKGRFYPKSLQKLVGMLKFCRAGSVVHRLDALCLARSAG